ncbi:MAG: hypothetical protein U0X74_07640 [Anaerolineales bacterium]
MVRKFSVVLLLLLQISCSAATPEPTATSTLLPPTATETPTQVPTATQPASPMPDAITYEGNGFRFDVPDTLDVDMQKNAVGIYDKSGMLIISFTRVPYDAASDTLEDVINEYLAEISSRSSGELTQSEVTAITVAGADGISVDLTGTLFERPIQGRAIAVVPGKDSVLFGMGVSNLVNDEKLWQSTGSLIFQGLLDSLEFVDVQIAAQCTVSTDKSYGYTETNPIKVGGDFIDGPARERAYLDNLLGSNGESLSYEREGSIPSGDTILDIYRVTGGGLDVKLYIDEYTYSPLLAPVGFTCTNEFISAP